MDRKNCPYCGEEIAATAKKCRFCGEWLEIEEAVLMPENADAAQIQEYASPAADIAVNGYTEGPLPAINVNGVPQQQYPQQQYPQQPMQQPVINIQVAQSQETNVSQEQTVIVEKRSSSSSGWLWIEIFGVAVRRGLVEAAPGQMQHPQAPHRPLVGRPHHPYSSWHSPPDSGYRHTHLRCARLRYGSVGRSYRCGVKRADMGMLAYRPCCNRRNDRY